MPGWAYKDGRPYMELPEPELTASASLQVQLQFYHVSICVGHPIPSHPILQTLDDRLLFFFGVYFTLIIDDIFLHC